VRLAPARTLASAGTAGAGALAGTAAYVIVGGVPGALYAAGIFLAAVVGAVAIRAGRTVTASEAEPAPRTPRWRREPRDVVESHPPPERAGEPERVAVMDPEALASGSELEEHRAALANLGAQLARESEAAARDMQRLEKRIRELETERDGLLTLVAQERARFEQTLDAICDGLGNELAELEPALEALIPS
jgi:hypothetical protein